jgi:hypothetical protein
LPFGSAQFVRTKFQYCASCELGVGTTPFTFALFAVTAQDVPRHALDTIGTPKNGRTREVPRCKQALEALRRPRNGQ